MEQLEILHLIISDWSLDHVDSNWGKSSTCLQIQTGVSAKKGITFNLQNAIFLNWIDLLSDLTILSSYLRKWLNKWQLLSLFFIVSITLLLDKHQCASYNTGYWNSNNVTWINIFYNNSFQLKTNMYTCLPYNNNYFYKIYKLPCTSQLAYQHSF